VTKTPPEQNGSELAATQLMLLTANSREAPAFNQKTPLQGHDERRAVEDRQRCRTHAFTDYWTFCHAQKPPANNSRIVPALSPRNTM
jgi:hypothetical protein